MKSCFDCGNTILLRGIATGLNVLIRITDGGTKEKMNMLDYINYETYKVMR